MFTCNKQPCNFLGHDNKNKKRSRTAIFSVNIADEKLVEQTTNRLYKQTKTDKKHLDEDIVGVIQADCFRDRSV